MQNKQISISAPGKSVLMSNSLPLVFIAGPCAMEGRDFALRTALELREIFEAAGVDFIYKSSFDKAN
ncbi:MAG: 3-deoxy-8-phosphooctulonate synthase, partial [Desulfocurvibacter africanus]